MYSPISIDPSKLDCSSPETAYKAFVSKIPGDVPARQMPVERDIRAAFTYDFPCNERDQTIFTRETTHRKRASAVTTLLTQEAVWQHYLPFRDILDAPFADSDEDREIILGIDPMIPSNIFEFATRYAKCPKRDFRDTLYQIVLDEVSKGNMTPDEAKEEIARKTVEYEQQILEKHKEGSLLWRQLPDLYTKPSWKSEDPLPSLDESLLFLYLWHRVHLLMYYLAEMGRFPVFVRYLRWKKMDEGDLSRWLMAMKLTYNLKNESTDRNMARPGVIVPPDAENTPFQFEGRSLFPDVRDLIGRALVPEDALEKPVGLNLGITAVLNYCELSEVNMKTMLGWAIATMDKINKENGKSIFDFEHEKAAIEAMVRYLRPDLSVSVIADERSGNRSIYFKKK